MAAKKTRKVYRKRVRKKKANKTTVALLMILEITVIIIFVLMIGWNKGIKTWLEDFNRPLVKELDISGINSSHAVLMRAKGGKIIGEINGDERMYPASITKVMTAIVAIEELKSLDEEIMMTEDMYWGLAENDATQAGFQPGEIVAAKHLIYGALLPSGAECCIGLANHIAGSEANFVELMNKKAAKLGMDNTHFCNTVGLHNEEHYSTAKDLAVMMRHCIRNKDFREMIESEWHYTGPSNVHPDGITYYSSMFKSLPDPSVVGGQILGGKTGYTDTAGLCLASYAQIDGDEYILVTGGAPGGTGNPLHVWDAQTIYNRLGEASLALH